MNERKQSTTLIGWGAIALFAIGSLGTVTMFMSMKYADRLPEQGKLGEFAQFWVSTFGLFPSLFLNAALLFLGARLFIKGGTRTLARNLVGSVALAVALSIFFGGLHAGSGGWIGAHTGEVVTSRAHIALGALVGLVSVFAAVWFTWLRSSTMGRPAFATSKATIEPAPKPAPKPLARPVATRLSTPQTAASDEGVTAAESEALFPFEEPAPKPIAVMPVVEPSPEPIEAVALMPRSPYPEDLRRKGQIPPGAKPLEPAIPPQTTAPAAYKWTAPRVSEDDAATDATAPAFETKPLFEAESAARGPRPLRRVEDDDELANDDVEVDESPVVAAYDADQGGENARGEAEDLGTTLRAETLEIEAESPAPGMPAPSWEQPALFRPEAGDEEPVDAYGTPLTLVEKLRQARRLAGLERDDAHVVEELAGDVTENTFAGELPAVGLTAAELGELMESSVVEEDDVEEDELAGDDDAEEDGDETEIRPMPSRAIPREIDAEYDAEAEFDDDEDDVATAEETEADELEDDTVVVGRESIDHEDIVIVGADDEELVTAAIAPDDVDLDDTDLDTDDQEDEEDEILVTEAIDEDAEVAMPMARASAEPMLEPLTLPAIAPIGRSEPIQPGLFDAPAPTAQPLQPAVAQAKPATTKVEAAPTKIERAPTKVEPAKTEAVKSEPTKPAIAPSKAEPVAKKPEPLAKQPAAKQPEPAAKQPEPAAKQPEPAAKQPEPAAKQPEPVAKQPEPVAKKPEPVPAKSEVAAPKSEPAPAKSASPAKSRATTSAEKDVVLQPAASTSAKPAAGVKSTSTDMPRPKVLSEIGCLFIERGRVAVSMLQRQYSMDFDEACKVLDDLQEMGLIGPYLGGQRRDILLTRDQWLERVSQAGAAR